MSATALSLCWCRPASPTMAPPRSTGIELMSAFSQLNQPRGRALMSPDAVDAIPLYKLQPSSDTEWAEVSKPLSKQVRTWKDEHAAADVCHK